MNTRSGRLTRNRAYFSSISPLLKKLKTEPEITYSETPIVGSGYALVDYVLKIPYTYFESLRENQINTEKERNKLLSSIYSEIVGHYPSECTKKIAVSKLIFIIFIFSYIVYFVRVFQLTCYLHTITVKDYPDGHQSFMPWYGTDRRAEETQSQAWKASEFEQLGTTDDTLLANKQGLTFLLYDRNDLASLPSNKDLQKAYLNFFLNQSKLFQESGISVAQIAYIVFNFKFLLSDYHSQSKLLQYSKRSGKREQRRMREYDPPDSD